MKDLENLKKEIGFNIEWLETSEGDVIECISIENLEGALSRFFGKRISLNPDQEESVEEEKPKFKQLEMFQDGLE
jgi:hypothetical protein